jgi:23S rRNA (guanosine2251-2'-O)-methyltransferase
MNCNYYQCSNEGCKFRFPSNEVQAGEFRCPACKSPVFIISSVEIQSESNSQKDGFPNHHIEALLDNIRSALNVGSMFRTADGFGLKHLYLCGITPTPEIRNVAKSSLGAERIIPWTYKKNCMEHVRKLKEQNKFIVAIEEHKKADSIFTINQKRLIYPIVVVVGNEVCGVDPEILNSCDLILNIPMMGVKKSLNVAVAFGIALSMLRFGCLNQKNAQFLE